MPEKDAILSQVRFPEGLDICCSRNIPQVYHKSADRRWLNVEVSRNAFLYHFRHFRNKVRVRIPKALLAAARGYSKICSTDMLVLIGLDCGFYYHAKGATTTTTKFYFPSAYASFGVYWNYSPQKRSEFATLLATLRLPSAVTTLNSRNWSTPRPYLSEYH